MLVLLVFMPVHWPISCYVYFMYNLQFIVIIIECKCLKKCLFKAKLKISINKTKVQRKIKNQKYLVKMGVYYAKRTDWNVLLYELTFKRRNELNSY